MSQSGIVLTPHLAWCSGWDAANMQARKAGRTTWNEEDYNLSVAVQARLIRHLGYPYNEIAQSMDPVAGAPCGRACCGGSEK